LKKNIIKLKQTTNGEPNGNVDEPPIELAILRSQKHKQ
jgi:hypothetical protein